MSSTVFSTSGLIFPRNRDTIESGKLICKERSDKMKKDIQLRKTAKPAPEKEKFYLFVKDQGEGAARVIVIVLKILLLIGTSIFGICFGILAPLAIMFSGDFDPEIAQCPAIPVWLASAVIYLIGTFVVMLGHSKIASIIDGIGALGTLITYYFFMQLFADIPDNNGPSGLYMPMLFLTIITVIIMLLINIPKWADAHAKKANAVAPSILGDEKED